MAETRENHLAWCKKRALELVDAGDWRQGLTSMMSDLGKHEETAGHSAIQLCMMMLLGGQIRGAVEARKFIEGFR